MSKIRQASHYTGLNERDAGIVEEYWDALISCLGLDKDDIALNLDKPRMVASRYLLNSLYQDAQRDIIAAIELESLFKDGINELNRESSLFEDQRHKPK